MERTGLMFSNNRMRYSWEGDLLSELSWPPRSYFCGFCKREFKSAQALGGHMNVHRRDRARLRQSPPWERKFITNPNPNCPSYFPSSTRPTPFNYKFPCISSSSSSSEETTVGRSETVKALFEAGQIRDFLQEDEGKTVKGAETVTVDLEIGLRCNMDLDLELRLGGSGMV